MRTSAGTYSCNVTSRTKTNFSLTQWGGNSSNIWYACGQGTAPTINYKRIIKY